MPGTGDISNTQNPYKRYPFLIVVRFIMAGIVVLFLSLTYGYLYTTDIQWVAFHLPKVFWLSTLAIVLVSVCMRLVLQLYDADRPSRLRWTLFAAFFLGVLFIIFQIIGWTALFRLSREAVRTYAVSSSNGFDYLYLLTGLHALHVLVGLIFLIVANVRTFIHTKDPVKALVFFSDPIRRIRLRLVITYWHTIDVLWVVLFLSFLFKHA
ncbi:MAG: cytochrome c oxidase subunit 3 [Chitinophagales bacterium]